MSKESEARKRALNGSTAKTPYQQKKQANARYNAKFDDIKIRVPKGARDVWKQAAAAHGKSLNAYLTGLMHADNPDLFSTESEKTE